MKKYSPIGSNSKILTLIVFLKSVDKFTSLTQVKILKESEILFKGIRKIDWSKYFLIILTTSILSTLFKWLIS